MIDLRAERSAAPGSRDLLIPGSKSPSHQQPEIELAPCSSLRAESSKHGFGSPSDGILSGKRSSVLAPHGGNSPCSPGGYPQPAAAPAAPAYPRTHPLPCHPVLVLLFTRSPPRSRRASCGGTGLFHPHPVRRRYRPPRSAGRRSSRVAGIARAVPSAAQPVVEGVSRRVSWC